MTNKDQINKKVRLSKLKRWEEIYMPKMLERYHIPKRIHSILLEQGLPPVNHLQSFNSMYIHGDSGTGKTVMAVQYMFGHMAYKFACSETITGSFITVPELLLEFRNTYNEKIMTETGLLNYYSGVGLLVLDDLGVQDTTAWSFQLLYMLINRRYNELLPIIITSNYNLSELAEKMEDDRIPSRLYEICDVIEQKHQYRHLL